MESRVIFQSEFSKMCKDLQIYLGAERIEGPGHLFVMQIFYEEGHLLF